MRKILSVIILVFYFFCFFCFSYSSAFAGGFGIKHGPEFMAFADYDQLNVVLSNVDVNRISVLDDKIQSLNGPTGLYVAKNDPSGAAYITINTHLPFTLFLSTEEGHNLSLFVTPSGTVGKTLILKPRTPSKKAQSWEESSSYQKMLVALISGMINNEAPEGYVFSNIAKAKGTKFYNVGVLKPKAVFNGAHLQGIVYEFTNKTRKPITLRPSYFYTQKVCAVALSEQTINPKGTGLVFEVINKD